MQQAVRDDDGGNLRVQVRNGTAVSLVGQTVTRRAEGVVFNSLPD